MISKQHFVLFIFVVFLLSACNQQGKEQSTETETTEQEAETVQSKDEMQKQIIKHEKVLHDDDELDVSKANDMIRLYLMYASQYKHDSLVPEYLFKAAELAMNVDRPYDAVAYLQRIDRNYPGFNKLALVIYLTGFIYDSMLNKDDTAETYYERFLDDWPEHPRAEEVRMLKTYLHMSDKELVEKFEKSNEKP
ncbi:MAG: tetratricopeptide repeat protein [Bacteroidales bacterium]|jgi:outer membrane protein assembly factor BamD (BamD/ComL family)